MSVRGSITRLSRAWRWQLTVPVLALLAVPLATSIGGASIPDGSGVIHTCYGEDHLLRVVDTATVDRNCKALETPLSWSQAGPTLLGFNAVGSAPYVTTNSTTFATVPGASTTVVVPPGKTATIVAAFTAESSCFGGDGYCTVRILVDGVEAAPVTGLFHAFDSSDANTETSESWESHAITRFAPGVGAGTHTVTVEWRAVDLGSTPTFSVFGHTLIVQAMQT